MNIQKIAFQVLRECSSWVPRNGAVQMSCLPEKCKVSKVFWLCCASIFFTMLIELRFLKWLTQVA